MLKVVGLKKSFGTTQVLKGIDLEVKKGEIVVIVGPSGGGKTTLLRCINDLEKPDSGLVKINDKVFFDVRQVMQTFALSANVCIYKTSLLLTKSIQRIDLRHNFAREFNEGKT